MVRLTYRRWAVISSPCPAYKFFGPHEGILYGRFDLLDRTRAYKVRPATNEPPGKFETGTQNHEGIAGTLAAVNHLAEIGERYGAGYRDRYPGLAGRRLNLKTGMAALRAYDADLGAAILDELETLPGVRIHGIADRSRLSERVPTVSFTWQDRHPRDRGCPGQTRDLCLGRELLRPGGDHPARPGRQGRHGSHWRSVLQHLGRNPPAW